jgi:hemolysin activation/secretion protein
MLPAAGRLEKRTGFQRERAIKKIRTARERNLRRAFTRAIRRFGAGAIALTLAFAAHAQDAEPRFPVRGFTIEGPLPIPLERAQAIVNRYTGDAVRVQDLQAAAAALEMELSTTGHPFHRVVLPPQELEGTVTLRVLAFRLANVSVKGNSFFSEENILASLPALKKGESPDVAAVGRNRSAANEHPSKTVEVTFKQSEAPDSVDADVAVIDQPPRNFFVGLNNIGDKRTGDYRATLGLQHSNLWNRDHSLTATYTTSPDHVPDVKQYGFYYRMPFYSVSGALTVFYAYSDVNSGTVAGAFQVSGRGRFGGLQWRQHLTPHGAYSHALEAALEDRFFDNNVTFSGTPLGVDVRSRPIMFSYHARYDTASSIVAGNVQYARNLGGGRENNDAAYSGNRAGATSDWDAWRYAAEGQRRIGSWALGFRVRGQYADQPLIPGEQFGLGGAQSVRGLHEREVTGDSGNTVTVEATIPLPAQGLAAIVFTDAGEVRSRNIAAGQPSRQNAIGAGFGLRWVVARRFSLGVDFAQVLNGVTTTDRGERRVHFSLVFRL